MDTHFCIAANPSWSKARYRSNLTRSAEVQILPLNFLIDFSLALSVGDRASRFLRPPPPSSVLVSFLQEVHRRLIDHTGRLHRGFEVFAAR